MMNLQRLKEAINTFHTGQHGGHNHHRAAIRRDAGGIIHARQQTRFQQQCAKPIHQRHGQLTRANEENQSEENKFPTHHIERLRLPHKPKRGK